MRPKSKLESPGLNARVAQGHDRSIEAKLPGDFPRPQESDFVLTVLDLRKSFTSPAGKRIEVLRGVALSAAAGEMIAVTGASGSGKSTLLQLLGGLDEADHGTILLNQFSLNEAPAAELARFRGRHIGFVFQLHHLLGDLSAAENVALPLLIARISSRKAMTQATQALESIGLGEKGAYPVGHLSGGEQQRVAVARALITEPALVLADEPTGNLDTLMGEELTHSLLNYCRSRRAIVIIATHNPRLAEACDRILTIQNGRLWPRSGEPSENRGSLPLY
jgi:lipoprotein-releasing system ATP-binding protein